MLVCEFFVGLFTNLVELVLWVWFYCVDWLFIYMLVFNVWCFLFGLDIVLYDLLISVV